MTVAGHADGSHNAGACRAEAFGSMGKAQAPFMGHLLDCSIGAALSSEVCETHELLSVEWVSSQKLLGEARIIQRFWRA